MVDASCPQMALLCVVSVAALVQFAASQYMQSDDKPNVIIMLMDDVSF